MAEVEPELPGGALVNRAPVKSGAVKSIGYDPATKIMEVEFVSGSVYRYHDVPAEAHAEIVSSKSIGGALNAVRIRENFAFALAEPDPEPTDGGL